MNPRGSIAGAILSAGASRRMGTPKALLRYQDESFLDRLIRLFSAVCKPVIVVLGHEADVIRAGLAQRPETLFALNPDPERGMLSSLQCGLRMVPQEAEGVLFTPVDHPNITDATVEALVEAFFAHRAPVTVPVYQGRRGHPVCITRRVAGELLELAVTSQASDVIHRYTAERRLIEVADPGVVADIDDPEAYRELVSGQRGLPAAVKL